MDPLSLTGLVFTGLVASSIVTLNCRKPHVPRIGRWPAGVVPCIYVASTCPIELQRIKEVASTLGNFLQRPIDVHPWVIMPEYMERIRKVPNSILIELDTSLGANVAGRATIIHGVPDIESLETDTIDFRSDGIESLELDETAKDVDGVPFIRRAKIGIPPLELHWNLDILIGHELVHAMGYGHIETPLMGRRKRDSKNGKKKAGDARKVFGVKVIGRKTNHLMNPYLSLCGAELSHLEVDPRLPVISYMSETLPIDPPGDAELPTKTARSKTAKLKPTKTKTTKTNGRKSQGETP